MNRLKKLMLGVILAGITACGGVQEEATLAPLPEVQVAPLDSSETADSNESTLALKTCHGGPSNGIACLYNTDCKSYCGSGPLRGYACLYHSDCGRACAGGSMAGYNCVYNTDCPGSYCVQHTCTTSSCY